MSFGENLAKLRKEKGMNQEELAQELNVSRQAVSKWESNNAYPETEKIIAICKLFDCSMDELIGLKDKIDLHDKNSKEKNNIYNIFANFKKLSLKEKIKKLLFIVICSIFLIVSCSIVAYFIFEFIFASFEVFTDDWLIIFSFICLVTSIFIFYKLYKNKKQYAFQSDLLCNNKNFLNESDKQIINFSWLNSLKKLGMLFCKLIILFLIFPTSIIFILSLALLLFNIYFVRYGIILVFTGICLIAISIIIYLVLEALIKLLLDMKLKTKRMFLMFTISLIVFGISLGCFFCELTTYKIETIQYSDLVATQNLDVFDDIILYDLDNSEIVFEERDDIKIEYYGNSKFEYDVFNGLEIDYIYGVETTYLSSRLKDYSLKDIINDILESVNKKVIYIFNDNFVPYREVIYISRQNYDKLIANKKDRDKFFIY